MAKIMSHPLSNNGRDEYDRIFKKQIPEKKERQPTRTRKETLPNGDTITVMEDDLYGKEEL